MKNLKSYVEEISDFIPTPQSMLHDIPGQLVSINESLGHAKTLTQAVFKSGAERCLSNSDVDTMHKIKGDDILTITIRITKKTIMLDSQITYVAVHSTPGLT